MKIGRLLKVLPIMALLVLTLQSISPQSAYAGAAEDCAASGGTWTDTSDRQQGIFSCRDCPSGKVLDGNVCKQTNSVQQSGSGCESASNFLSFPTWYKYLEKDEDSTGRCTPVVEDLMDVIPILVAAVEILLRIVGLVSVGFVIYGSIRYILSQGQPDATKSARQTIINAIIGVAISIVAAGAVSFFATRLTSDSSQAYLNNHPAINERHTI